MSQRCDGRFWGKMISTGGLTSHRMIQSITVIEQCMLGVGTWGGEGGGGVAMILTACIQNTGWCLLCLQDLVIIQTAVISTNAQLQMYVCYLLITISGLLGSDSKGGGLLL